MCNINYYIFIFIIVGINEQLFFYNLFGHVGFYFYMRTITTDKNTNRNNTIVLVLDHQVTEVNR